MKSMFPLLFSSPTQTQSTCPFSVCRWSFNLLYITTTTTLDVDKFTILCLSTLVSSPIIPLAWEQATEYGTDDVIWATVTLQFTCWLYRPTMYCCCIYFLVLQHRSCILVVVYLCLDNNRIHKNFIDIAKNSIKRFFLDIDNEIETVKVLRWLF